MVKATKYDKNLFFDYYSKFSRTKNSVIGINNFLNSDLQFVSWTVQRCPEGIFQFSLAQSFQISFHLVLPRPCLIKKTSKTRQADDFCPQDKINELFLGETKSFSGKKVLIQEAEE